MITVTKERWELFEFYHRTYTKRVPNWRYGQAVMNFFSKELTDVMSDEDDQTLFYTEDANQAQTIIDRYLQVDVGPAAREVD